MDTQAESRIFSQGQLGEKKKMSGLGPTEMDRTLWAVFGQEPS